MSNILSNLATWGTFVFMGLAALGVWVGGWRSGRSDRANGAEQTIVLLKEGRDALDVKAKELERVLEQAKIDTKKQIDEKDKVIYSLEEQLKAKDQIIEHYVTIFQGKNPELETFMKNTTVSIGIVEKSIEKILQTLIAK